MVSFGGKGRGSINSLYAFQGIREHSLWILALFKERNNLLGNFSEILVVGTNPSGP